MLGFHDLYFKKDPIPPHLKKGLKEMDFVSEDGGTTCRRYLLLLAETCQVRKLQVLEKMWTIDHFVIRISEH